MFPNFEWILFAIEHVGTAYPMLIRWAPQLLIAMTPLKRTCARKQRNICKPNRPALLPTTCAWPENRNEIAGTAQSMRIRGTPENLTAGTVFNRSQLRKKVKFCERTLQCFFDLRCLCYQRCSLRSWMTNTWWNKRCHAGQRQWCVYGNRKHHRFSKGYGTSVDITKCL